MSPTIAGFQAQDWILSSIVECAGVSFRDDALLSLPAVRVFFCFAGICLHAVNWYFVEVDARLTRTRAAFIDRPVKYGT